MARKRVKKTKRRVGNKTSPRNYYFLGIGLGIILVSAGMMLVNYFQNGGRLTNQGSEQNNPVFNNPQTFDVPILLYHYVEYVKDARDTIRRSLDITPYTFEHQVQTLKDGGYTFLTPKDLNTIIENKMALPKKSVILSFDDGYEDFYTDVLPILKKYNVRAVEYVVSGFLDQPNYMTRAEVREVIASNLVEIGCHTVHHLSLKNASEALARSEIFGCENQIFFDFGVRPVSFAYPYGVYNDSLYPILKQAGLKNAVTTKLGAAVSTDNIYDIPRIRPGTRIGEELITYLNLELAKAPISQNAVRP